MCDTYGAIGSCEATSHIRRDLVLAGKQGILGETFRNLARFPGVWIVCDFDDTLFATSDFHRQSFEKVLSVLGVTQGIPRSYVRLLRGRIDFEVFRILLSIARGDAYAEMIEDMPSLSLLPNGLDETFHGVSREEQMNSCVAMRRRFLLESVEGHMPEKKPGLDEFVAWFREAGMVCGIASSGPDRFVNTVVSTNNMGDVFPANLVVGSETLEEHENAQSLPYSSLAKPNPFSVYLSAQRIGAHVGGAIIYIGDSEIDCVLTSGSGTKLIGIIVNPERRGEFEATFPELVFVNSLKALMM